MKSLFNKTFNEPEYFNRLYNLNQFTRISEEQNYSYSNLFKVTDMVEKPKPSSAPSDLAIIGRYILTPDIFKYIEKGKPGKGGEIQITDAIKALLKSKPVYGFLFEGRRYDAGDKVGFLTATVELALKNNAVKKDFREYLVSILPKISKEK